MLILAGGGSATMPLVAFGSDDAVQTYLGELFWPEDELLRELRADLARRGPQIAISAASGAALATLLRTCDAQRVLEVGTLFGYSGIWIARGLPAAGHLDTVEVDDVHADAAQDWFTRAGLASRITIHRGAALEIMPQLAGPYDAIFIDAVKSEYPAYLDHAPRLLRPGGVVIADNVLQRGRIGDSSATEENVRGMRAFLERVADRVRWQTTVLPVGDGLSVSVLR